MIVACQVIPILAAESSLLRPRTPGLLDWSDGSCDKRALSAAWRRCEELALAGMIKEGSANVCVLKRESYWGGGFLRYGARELAMIARLLLALMCGRQQRQ